MSATNGGPAPQTGMAQVPAPQIGVLTQYVKDFSFENPNAPRSMAPNSQQPAISINIGVDAAPLTETDVEVTLRLDGKANSQGMLLFGFELLYSRRVPHPQRAARQRAADGDDRVPAPVVSVRARNHCHGDAQRRLPAVASGTDRFRRSLSATLGGRAAFDGAAQSKLT